MADINSTNSSFGSEYDSTKSTSGTSYTGGAYGSSTTPRETENSFSNMMFTWLTQEGAVDTSAVNIPASGSLSLDNTSSSN